MYRSNLARTLGTLAVSASMAVTLTACTGSEDDGAKPDPAAVTAAIAKLDETSHTLTLTAGDMMSGNLTVDPATDSHLGLVEVDPILTIVGEEGELFGTDFIKIGVDEWWRMGASPDGKWVHTAKAGEDYAKMAGLNLPQLRDELLGSLDKVTGVKENTFTATVDPTKLTALGSGEPITVTITLDEQGLLTKISGEIPDPRPEAAKDTMIPVALEFSGYNEKVEIKAPDESDVTDLDT